MMAKDHKGERSDYPKVNRWCEKWPRTRVRNKVKKFSGLIEVNWPISRQSQRLLCGLMKEAEVIFNRQLGSVTCHGDWLKNGLTTRWQTLVMFYFHTVFGSSSFSRRSVLVSYTRTQNAHKSQPVLQRENTVWPSDNRCFSRISSIHSWVQVKITRSAPFYPDWLARLRACCVVCTHLTLQQWNTTLTTTIDSTGFGCTRLGKTLLTNTSDQNTAEISWVLCVNKPLFVATEQRRSNKFWLLPNIDEMAKHWWPQSY